jgi:hypothetical protein
MSLESQRLALNSRELELNIKYKSGQNLRVVAEKITNLIMESRFLHNKLYLPWLQLDEIDKRGFRRQVRQIIANNLLGEQFLLAIAKDVLEGGVNIENYVFRYIKNRIYRGNVRLLLMDLSSVLEKDRLKKEKQKFLNLQGRRRRSALPTS